MLTAALERVNVIATRRGAKDSCLADLASDVGQPIDPSRQMGMGWWLGMEMDHAGWERFATWCEEACRPST